MRPIIPWSEQLGNQMGDNFLSSKHEHEVQIYILSDLKIARKLQIFKTLYRQYQTASCILSPFLFFKFVFIYKPAARISGVGVDYIQLK